MMPVVDDTVIDSGQVLYRYWTHMSPVYLRELLSDCSSQLWCKHWSACLPLR